MKLDELEHLRLQNINLRLALIQSERDALTVALVAKYGKPGDKSIQIAPDGTIIAPAKLESVPAASEIDDKSA